MQKTSTTDVAASGGAALAGSMYIPGPIGISDGLGVLLGCTSSIGMQACTSAREESTVCAGPCAVVAVSVLLAVKALTHVIGR